ncbi:endospore germination permease [Vallitalea pronyensis]|uniref:Endospore germination permease n=1 Tax=Vallitalea pronyensis TaxID=1348613 RepID=A0A8J8MH51_9FIRM|nr:endospore germination permease [Vallitalea pronyensis]QUI21397.1 endospore germination permease [Vallitalea pronyensis]
MFSQNNKVSIRQIKILIILNLFSNTSLILPRLASEIAAEDGWIIVIGGAIVSLVYVWVITSLIKLFPRQDILSYTELIFSRPVAVIIGILFAIKLVILAGLEIRVFGELVKQTLLRDTPIEIIVITMLFVVAYLTRKGFEARARMAELLIFVVIIPLVLIFLFTIPDIEIYHISPIFMMDMKTFAYGSLIMSMIYSGLELLLLSAPFVNKPKRIPKAALTSVIFVAVLNGTICLLTIGTFGPIETSRQLWPVMSIMQTIHLPGSLIQRQDALMVSFWIMTVFLLINAYLFFSTHLLKKVTRLKEQNFLVLPLLPIVYLISLMPDNIVETYDWLRIMTRYVSILFLLPIPLILLIGAKLKGLGEQANKKEVS